MESLLIHPENATQLKTVKAILKALNVQFEPQSNHIPVHVREGINESMKQHESGQSISFEEFKAKHFTKK